MPKAITTCFEKADQSGLPSPSHAELLAYHAVVGGEFLEPRVGGGDSPDACGVCTISERTMHHMRLRVYEPLGHDLYDYPQLYAESSDALAALLKEMRGQAEAARADAVSFPTVLWPEGLAAPRQARQGETCVFDAEASANGWDFFVAKKSLRYQRNKLRKLFRYEVTHRRGAEISEEDVATLARLHRERWAFDGVDSLLATATREREYLCHLENKILTTVSVDGEVLATNFSMAFGDTLVWHTVVVNIKFIDHSPLQVLLLETAELCRSDGFRLLDFGVGDESYKERFANRRRTVHSIFIPISARARAASALWKVVPPERVKTGLLRARKRAGAAKFRVETHINRIVCYETTGGGDAPDAETQLEIAETYPDFVDMSRRLGFPAERMAYERYQEGSQFAALHDGCQLVSRGWVTRTGPFWIGELDRYVSLDGSVMLYDFETPPEHRRRGHYTTLLRSLLTRYPGECLRIFVLTGNVASNKAVLRAGFAVCEMWPEAPRPEGSKR
jgi:hypothetical protein